jgi:hypothetical protein
MLTKKANSEIVLDVKHQVQPEIALSSTQITERFTKVAAELKKVAPKSGDFLYFIARGIHSMEHAAIDPVTRQYNPAIGHMAYDDGTGCCQACKELGKQTTLFKSAHGPISGMWCSTSQVEPWINQNGDAFPERELLAEVVDQRSGKTIRAYQTFIEKGLFTDHKSSEVENIRGIILDAEYDHKSKGVDLLIALDKVSYPELARQITAGYSAQVSMGTAVTHSYCSICGNKAITEHDYCDHVKRGKAVVMAGQPRVYEINNGLNFIELSVVGNAADPRARIRTIVASAKQIRATITANLENNPQHQENQLILNSIDRLENQINDLQSILDNNVDNSTSQNITQEIVNKIATIEEQIKQIGGRFMAQKQEKKAYMQGTVEPEKGKPFDMADKDYHKYWEDDVKQTGPDQTNGTEGMHPGYGMGSDEEVKKHYLRASAEERRLARQKLLERTAYMQGTVEPEKGKPFDMADKDYHKYWEDDVKQTGPDQTNGTEGMHPGYGMGSDEQVKKELLRANKLKARLVKSADSKQNRWIVLASNDATEETLFTLSAEEAYGKDLNQPAVEIDNTVSYQQWFDSEDYGRNLLAAVRQNGVRTVVAEIESNKKKVTAQVASPEVPPAPPVEAPAAPVAPVEPTVEPVEEQQELSAAESIVAASERIESAAEEIKSLTEELTGEAAQQGGELVDELTGAGQELGEIGQELNAVEQLPPAQAKLYSKIVRQALSNAENLLTKAAKFVVAMDDECECEDEDCKCEDKKEDKDSVKIEVQDADKEDVKVKEANLKNRQLARRKVAQQLYNLTKGDMIDEAHPQGGNTTTIPGNPQGKVETVKEQQQDDVEAVNAQPTGEVVARSNKRRKLLAAAEKYLQRVAQTATTSTDNSANAIKQQADKIKADEKKQQQATQKVQEGLKEMQKTQQSEQPVRTAEVDKETKQYYKELASESATGEKPDSEVSKFYNDLTQDFAKRKATVAMEDYGLKMKRAYAVAIKRANLGQIESTQDALDADVDRLMKLTDDSFTAFAEVIENTKKTASTVQRVKSEEDSKQIKTAGALRVGIDPTPPTITDKLTNLPWSR